MDTGLDPVMIKIRKLQEERKIDLATFGKLLGYAGDTRRAAQQFLLYTTDPKVSMVRKVAQAFKISMSDLFKDDEKILR